MARVVRVMGPRIHLDEAEQRQRVVTVVAEVRRLLAAGERDEANAVILHGVHDGIDAIVMAEEFMR